MRLDLASPLIVEAGLAASAGLAVGLLAYSVAAGDTLISQLFAKYVHFLDRTLRLLFRPPQGKLIALGQLVVLALVGVTKVTLDLPYALPLALVVAGLPPMYLWKERKARIAKLEDQVDGFVMALANSLKTVPSPAAALQATVGVLQQPTRQEIEQILKEMRVGSTLEQGLVAMSARVESRWVDTAFSAVLIGLRVGGNLPAVLERTAATIREMNRLLGVVRTKTGEGRMQLWVLALFPLFIVFGFNAMQKGYFDPLQQSVIGQISVGIAVVLWLASIVVARKILSVDV